MHYPLPYRKHMARSPGGKIWTLTNNLPAPPPPPNTQLLPPSPFDPAMHLQFLPTTRLYPDREEHRAPRTGRGES